jgi:predicted homoserine dehydrogenase-like protein
MELSISVLSAALRGEATGSSREWRGDAVAVAKRDLKAGEVLDGEGGFTVYGKACPAAVSAARAHLPIGLAHRVRLRRDVARGEILGMADVELDESATGVILRRQMLADGGGQH